LIVILSKPLLRREGSGPSAQQSRVWIASPSRSKLETLKLEPRTLLMPSYPNRCQHIKINGTQCGSPALRRNRFCFFHKRFHDERIRLSTDRARRRAPVFELPVLEDANSIQIALMQVMRLILTQQIDHKSASLLLYALQTASSNLRQTDFSPYQHDVVLDSRSAAETPLDSHVWEDEDFEEEDEVEEEDDEAAETEPVVTHLNSSSTPEQIQRYLQALRDPEYVLHKTRDEIQQIKEELQTAICEEDGERTTAAFDQMMRLVNSLASESARSKKPAASAGAAKSASTSAG
jgi:hypothetical protein